MTRYIKFSASKVYTGVISNTPKKLHNQLVIITPSEIKLVGQKLMAVVDANKYSLRQAIDLFNDKSTDIEEPSSIYWSTAIVQDIEL